MGRFWLGFVLGFFISSLLSGLIVYFMNRPPGEVLEVRDREYVEVEVRGEVKRPGIYKLKAGARVIDAIEMAGGLGEEAFTLYIDLLREIEEGEVIYVPRRGEVPQRVNINTAPEWLLRALPGVDEKIARRIIEGRPYRSIEEIKRVKGIGEKKFRNLRDKITVR